MSETLQAQEIMLAALAGALVVLFGAIYAGVFALSRLRHASLMPFAYAAYALFAASTWVLADSLHFEGFWLVVIGVMLVGYLLAPHAVWHLCVGTHMHVESISEGEN